MGGRGWGWGLGNFPQKFDSRTAKTAETIRARGAIWKIQIELVLSIINLAQAVAHQKNHAQLKGATKKNHAQTTPCPSKKYDLSLSAYFKSSNHDPRM